MALGFIASQITAIDTLDVKHLWMVSTVLGLAYGSLFNVMPMLVLEWFGMSEFLRKVKSITDAIQRISVKSVMFDNGPIPKLTV